MVYGMNIDRIRHLQEIQSALGEAPAVVLIGSRQVGKTTLARKIAETRNAVYLDLERPADLRKLHFVNSAKFRNTFSHQIGKVLRLPLIAASVRSFK
jgi:predicted AAA+ superfamily ATPase